MLRFVGCFLLVATLAPWSFAGESPSFGEELGTVVLPASCTDEAKRHLRRGWALLHHMTYEGARDAFAAAGKADPKCALAYWGEAMTYVHPLWSDPPTEEGFERARSLVEKGRALEDLSDVEGAYLDAIAGYFAAGRSRDERPNLAAYEAGWEAVHQAYPDDPEARSFYALSILGTVDSSDKSFAGQKRAGEMAEAVLEAYPEHPGGHHYVIHAYDYPPLAEDALAVARNYGEIAPAVPHALHMPTHIFTRLGLWPESIVYNGRSAEAARRHPAGDKISLHLLHALDYLAYAHLQRAEPEKAEAVAKQLAALEGPFQVEVATPYTFAAVPARLALERQRWKDAAALQPRVPESYPWDRFPAIEAISHFARALGAARSGRLEAARESIERLAALHDRAAETSAYWAQQVEIQRLAARAWVEYAEGRGDEGLATMRSAAELEASTEKHPVTPGEVLPARELLADMLLDMERYDEAQAAYEAALDRSPNRFNSLYGAGRAAEMRGDLDEARRWYGQLDEVCAEGPTPWERLTHARKMLEAHPGR